MLISILFIHPDFTVWLFITAKVNAVTFLEVDSNVTCHHLSDLPAAIIIYHPQCSSPTPPTLSGIPPRIFP